jgi:hypothetical protein
MTIQSSNNEPGPGKRGRPAGYKTPATIRKLALKALEQILLDENSPAEARVMAASKLVDEIQNRQIAGLHNEGVKS